MKCRKLTLLPMSIITQQTFDTCMFHLNPGNFVPGNFVPEFSSPDFPSLGDSLSLVIQFIFMHLEDKYGLINY